MFLDYVFRVVICILLLFIYMYTVGDQLPRLGKRELICLLLFACNYVVSVWGGFLFLWVLGMGYVILLWHSLSFPYNYFIMVKNGVGTFSQLFLIKSFSYLQVTMTYIRAWIVQNSAISDQGPQS